jgi:hypothetical protein
MPDGTLGDIRHLRLTRAQLNDYTRKHQRERRTKYLSHRPIFRPDGSHTSVHELQLELYALNSHTPDFERYCKYIEDWTKLAQLLRPHYADPEYRIMRLHEKIGKQRCYADYAKRLAATPATASSASDTGPSMHSPPSAQLSLHSRRYVGH